MGTPGQDDGDTLQVAAQSNGVLKESNKFFIQPLAIWVGLTGF